MPIRANDQIIHKAAWLYYTHGLRQDEVAKRLEISRASIAMYLRRAREMGIVTITTSSELFSDEVLARELLVGDAGLRNEQVAVTADLDGLTARIALTKDD